MLVAVQAILAQCDAPFEEVNGLVVVEIESVSPASGWVKKTNAVGYTGSGYYSWEGGDNFNSPGSGILEYKVKIKTPGTYRFQWYNKVGLGTNSTEHNDSWLKIPDASDFYAKKGTSIKHPKGVCTSDCPAGAGANGWFKVYLSGTVSWTWSSMTNDNDPYEIFADFNTAGVYTVQISGRSNYHLIDRFVLYNSSAVSPLNLTNAETLCIDNGKLNQTITYPAIANKITTDAPFTISATASSSLPVSFAVVSGPASVLGNTVTLTGATGTVVIRATQLGNAQFNAAPAVERSFIVSSVPGVTYNLTVINGSGDGLYEQAAVVNITADAAPVGKVFDKWTGNISGIAVVSASSTTLTMPTANVTIEATYKDMPVPGSTVIGINVGGSAYTAIDGTIYQADSYFTGGSIYNKVTTIAGTEDDALYNFERYGSSLSYAIPLVDGDYTVTLKFAEIYHSAIGKRVFNIAIEGVSVAQDVDIFAAVGKDVAYDLIFPVSIVDGQLNIALTTKVDNAKLSGILIQTSVITGTPKEIGSEKQQKIMLFPNPCREYLTVHGIEQGSKISIIDAIGQTVDIINLNEKIFTGNFAPGLYFLVYQNQTFKFVKE
jgi:hypothetical protein